MPNASCIDRTGFFTEQIGVRKCEKEVNAKAGCMAMWSPSRQVGIKRQGHLKPLGKWIWQNVEHRSFRLALIWSLYVRYPLGRIKDSPEHR
ncbi:hypothetical protein NPIL_692001 [Nephila pilipes]|uniref:Uncharacterized protein n=1 Tax=Nephila pilipes TaxID=299642 RepID=A0A8X6NYA1_NEPPI|nr:hypothetical protein NPIL_692001 [Nephila pilipes]